VNVATGPDVDKQTSGPDVEGGGAISGEPARAQLEGSAYNPMGGPGVAHWQASYVSKPGLDDRGGVFFAAIEMTRMPMLVTDPNQPDNPIVFANRAFQDLTGYAEQEILGRNCRMLQGPDTDPAAVAEIREAVAAHRAVALDILNYKRDGRPFWNALFIGPIFDQQGHLLYFFASQLDITRRRFSEQSFRQAQKMEAIGQLTAGLAHDFNNLLQVVSGNLELARLKAGEDPVVAKALERASRATHKGARLTQQLLTFARKQHLESRRVNLNSLVVDFSDMIARTLGGAVQLRLDLDGALPPCDLDPTHFEMALLNVLINARDAMAGGGTVTIATTVYAQPAQLAERELPQQPHVVLCVRDEGPGMPAEVRRRAMEPFFTTKGAQGTGLGLAMVHGFVQQSRGKVEIESREGQGTTVRMIFPAATHDRPAPGPRPQPRAGVSSATVLVVDDSDDVREVAEGYLESLGCACIPASSGEAALRLLQAGQQADLLLTDVVMPGGMSGTQLAAEARRLRPELPVVLMTGYTDELPEREHGALEVLHKPFRRAELADKLQRMLGRAGGGADAFRHEG
jgi:PAS domain S-box-containing protein